jgi:hypothetical protein
MLIGTPFFVHSLEAGWSPPLQLRFGRFGGELGLGLPVGFLFEEMSPMFTISSTDEGASGGVVNLSKEKMSK